MSNLGFNFDARTVDPATAGGSSLPVGDQPVIVESSEVKPTKDNDGGYLQLNLRVIDGPHKGASGPWRLNLYNQSPKAVEIAYRQLSALCHCVGVYQVNDSTQLHNRPFVVVVGPQDDPKYTEVKGCKDIHGNSPKSAGAAPQQQQAPAGMPPGMPPGMGQPAPQQAPAQAWAPQQPAPAGQPWAQQGQQQPAQPPQPPQQGGWTPPPQQPAQQPAQAPAQGGWTPPGAAPAQPAQAPAPAWAPGGAAPAAPAWAQR